MSDYLKRLGTLAEYNTFKDSDDFVTPSVVYVDELDMFVKDIQNNCLDGFTLTIGD